MTKGHQGLGSPGGSWSPGRDITGSRDFTLHIERNTLACSIFMLFYFLPVLPIGLMQLEASSDRCQGIADFRVGCYHCLGKGSEQVKVKGQVLLAHFGPLSPEIAVGCVHSRLNQCNFEQSLKD